MGLSVLAGAALVKSVMEQHNPMVGQDQFPRCVVETFDARNRGLVSAHTHTHTLSLSSHLALLMREIEGSSPCLQKPNQWERKIDSRIPKLKTEVASPSTPLSFSPSESEAKSKKIFKKKTRKKWLEIIDGLIERKELLTREVDVVVWGKISMVDAQQRLLVNALKDPDNQHFVLLSDRSG